MVNERQRRTINNHLAYSVEGGRSPLHHRLGMSCMRDERRVTGRGHGELLEEKRARGHEQELEIVRSFVFRKFPLISV